MAAARYKVALFIKRDAAIDGGAFSEHWLGMARGDWRVHDGLLCYVHNNAAGADVPIENAPSAPFDAVDEFVFESASHAEGFFASALFRKEWLGPRERLLREPLMALRGATKTIWRHLTPKSDTDIKILTLPVRRPGMTMGEFADYWMVHHAGLALAGPRTKERLQRLESCPSDGRQFEGFKSSPFDGIGTIQFESMEALNAEFTSDYYREVMAPDEPRFTDPSRSAALMVKEHVAYAAESLRDCVSSR